MVTLNEVYSSLSVHRRYEVWFIRLGLADGSGAWWFRYLLMNPGRDGCIQSPQGKPVQVWATWFPVNGPPQSFIQGFPVPDLDLSRKGQAPFHFRIGENAITEDSCTGALRVDGHDISWTLHYRSTFRVTLSNKGWIGFSRTPHSDAYFSGEIIFDGRRVAGDPLGFGVQGHNCGYRHRGFWTWAHAYFPRERKPASTLEALVYDMPLGLRFRKAVLWHDGAQHIVTNLRERVRAADNMTWSFRCAERGGLRLDAEIVGHPTSIHHLPYVRTDCSGSFEVRNCSLASAQLVLRKPDGSKQKLETDQGAVLEMVG